MGILTESGGNANERIICEYDGHAGLENIRVSCVIYGVMCVCERT